MLVWVYMPATTTTTTTTPTTSINQKKILNFYRKHTVDKYTCKPLKKIRKLYEDLKHST